MNTISFKQYLLSLRRHLAIQFGNYKYCQVGNWKLVGDIFADKRDGVFVEAGAHDGWTGSNTYWLESMGWRGVLVEPVPGLYRACRKERPRCRVYHGALVSHEYPDPTIPVECSGLVSSVSDSKMLEETRAISEAYYGKKERPKVSVPALKLDDVLSDANVESVDFLSLDVEGFEGDALRGFDLAKWSPDYMLIECNYEQEVIGVVRGLYSVVQKVGEKDLLFRKK